MVLSPTLIVKAIEQRVASIAADIKELAKPINHFSFEKCNALLTGMLKNLEEIGQPAKWGRLKDAVAASHEIINLHGYDFNRYAHLNNLPERARWLELEFNAATRVEHPKTELAELRELFQEKNAVVNIWRDEFKKNQELYWVGTIRTQSRLLNQDLRTVAAQLEKADLQQLQAGFHLVKDSIRTRMFGTRMEMFEGAKKYPKINELIPITDRFNQVLGRFKHSNKKDDYLHFVRELAQIATVFEQESRIVFSEELGYKLTPAQHRKVSIFEQCGTIDRNTTNEILTDMAEWKVDLSNPVEQRGYGRPYTVEEFENFFTKHGASLIRTEIDGKAVGNYILYLDSNKFPPYVKKILAELEAAGEHMGYNQAFCETVFKTKVEGAEIERQTGINTYDLLHASACESYGSGNRQVAYATSRTGPTRNLSEGSHKKRTWQETGLEMTLGVLPYKILRLRLGATGRASR